MNEFDAFVSRLVALGLTGTPATLAEVEGLEQQFNVKLPAAYTAFLLILGRDGGPDFIGSDCTIRHLPGLRVAAEELIKKSGSQFQLPRKPVVFLMHQGYSFVYFVADETSEDPPVFFYQEGDAAPMKKAERFTDWLLL